MERQQSKGSARSWRVLITITLIAGSCAIVTVLCMTAATTTTTTTTTTTNLWLGMSNWKTNWGTDPRLNASNVGQQKHRHLLMTGIAQVDEGTLMRYKSDPPGFRRHPSYYSDRYVTRARGPVGAHGTWTLIDGRDGVRPDDDYYDRYPHRDVPWNDLPDGTAWQKDATYLRRFLDEGIALTERAMEAILTEYGFGPDHDTRPFEERISVLDGKDDLFGDSYANLVRRVLHAIVTQDTFVFAMSGHSAAAGHGNHFQQSYTHAYGVILEPVFARLGVFATSRNFGFGGLGTLQTGMASAALMGPDVDVLMWDSGMTEKGPPVGILGLQAALGGERIPLFLLAAGKKGSFGRALYDAGVDAGLMNANKLQQKANTMEELEAQPFAAKCLSWDKSLKPACGGNQYRGVCWIDRTGFEWGSMDMGFTPKELKQEEPGGRAGWHPGDRVHQVMGRSIAGLILHAIRDSLLLWKNSDNLVLKDEDWHVTSYYQGVRANITTTHREEVSKWCKASQLPERMCQVPMQARTEHTPRYDPARTSLRSIIKVTDSPFEPTPAVYDPPDVFNPNLHAPEGSIDVLGIVESGVEFAPNFGRIRRRKSLAAADSMPPRVGSSVNPEIKPGRGWDLNQGAGADMCDGEYDSWCKRSDDQSCMLYAHNDNRGSIQFDGLSGWGIFELPDVREGLIVIKVHDWVSGASTTTGWTTENNEVDAAERKLGPSPYCDDFKFQFAIDGKVTSWDRDTWKANMKSPERVIRIATLLDEPNFTGGETKNVELAMRMIGCGRVKGFGLTHIYWS